MLNFIVGGQQILRTDNTYVVADSKNYLKASFIFTSDWEGVVKTAVFKQGEYIYNVVLLNDSCYVPVEVLNAGEFTVSVYGGDLITADVVSIPVYESGFEEGQTPEPPTPDVYSQIMDMLGHLQGGQVDYVLSKISDNDFDFEWVKPADKESTKWGEIQGDITAQADLQSAFNGKADKSIVPTKVSDLKDDVGITTTAYVDNAVNTVANSKVDKVKGKGLSTNDFTNTEKVKLMGLVEVKANPTVSGSEQVLESIEINNTKFRMPSGGGSGAVQSVNGKVGAVNLTASDVKALPANTKIPSKVSELDNDEGYATDNEIAIRYNSANDMIQLRVNGAWIDWKNAGLHEPVKITPALTSNNTPSGYVATCSSKLEDRFDVWKAFDEIHDVDDSWISQDNQGIDSWIQIELPEPKPCTVLKLRNRNSWNLHAPHEFELYGSNGLGFEKIASLTNTENASDAVSIFKFENSNLYKIYRVKINSLLGTDGNNSWVAIGELELFG